MYNPWDELGIIRKWHIACVVPSQHQGTSVLFDNISFTCLWEDFVSVFRIMAKCPPWGRPSRQGFNRNVLFGLIFNFIYKIDWASPAWFRNCWDHFGPIPRTLFIEENKLVAHFNGTQSRFRIHNIYCHVTKHEVCSPCAEDLSKGIQQVTKNSRRQ